MLVAGPNNSLPSGVLPSGSWVAYQTSVTALVNMACVVNGAISVPNPVAMPSYNFLGSSSSVTFPLSNSFKTASIGSFTVL